MAVPTASGIATHPLLANRKDVEKAERSNDDTSGSKDDTADHGRGAHHACRSRSSSPDQCSLGAHLARCHHSCCCDLTASSSACILATRAYGHKQSAMQRCDEGPSPKNAQAGPHPSGYTLQMPQVHLRHLLLQRRTLLCLLLPQWDIIPTRRCQSHSLEGSRLSAGSGEPRESMVSQPPS